jgi:hypothetical protein
MFQYSISVLFVIVLSDFRILLPNSGATAESVPMSQLNQIPELRTEFASNEALSLKGLKFSPTLGLTLASSAGTA